MHKNLNRVPPIQPFECHAVHICSGIHIGLPTFMDILTALPCELCWLSFSRSYLVPKLLCVKPMAAF